jgi:hypothetical protein
VAAEAVEPVTVMEVVTVVATEVATEVAMEEVWEEVVVVAPGEE